MNLKTDRLLRLSWIAWVAVAALAAAKSPIQRVPLPDSFRPAVSRSVVTGSPSPGSTIYLSIGLVPRHPAELQAFCDSVSDPRSPNYRQYMTPEQVGESFGASPTDVNNVLAFLKAQGIKVTLSAPNRMAILASGTVAQVEAAFGIHINNYRGTDPGGLAISYFASSGPATVPSNIAPVIQSLNGTDDYYRPHPKTTLSVTQARTLYNTAPSYGAGTQGQGRKIGYSNWDNFRLADGATFITTFGLPVPGGGSMSNVHVVAVGAAHNTTTAGFEGNLDMQMLLGAAPLADIYVYDNNGSDLIGILTKEASDNLADIISESWGWRLPQATANTAHNQHLSMTAQGMTYLCASGDSGTGDLNGTNSFPYPDVDPEVTNVGGTLATTNGSGVRTSEVSWSGSGGGWCLDQTTYLMNTHPTWQVGNGVPSGRAFRLVPDVAMQADSASGAFIIIVNGAQNGISGTSCSSPFFTSCLSTLEQRLVALSLPGRFGRINDLIYSENGNASIWFDITGGSSNGTLPDSTSGSPHAGWDFVTGWGAPNFDGWYTALSNRTISGTVTLGSFLGTVSGTQVTIQLYQAGTSTLVDTKTTTLDASGNFSVTSQAPGGNYDVYAKCSHWLRRKVVNRSFMLAGITGLSFTLINGDVNGDNVITNADLLQLRNAFGSVPTDTNWNPNADLNGSGAVTNADLLILRNNFGQAGD